MLAMDVPLCMNQSTNPVIRAIRSSGQPYGSTAQTVTIIVTPCRCGCRIWLDTAVHIQDPVISVRVLRLFHNN